MQHSVHTLSSGISVLLNLDNLLSGKLYWTELHYRVLPMCEGKAITSSNKLHSFHVWTPNTVEFFEFQKGGRRVTFQCMEWSSSEQEVMIDTPAASLQRHNGTKEQKTNMKLMSKALGFCLWSCIGVISEEGPCPCTTLLSKPPLTIPAGVRREEDKGSSLWGMEAVVMRGMSRGRMGLEVTAGLWPDERGSCGAKRLFWHHDWAPWAKVPNPYYMDKDPAD